LGNPNKGGFNFLFFKVSLNNRTAKTIQTIGTQLSLAEITSDFLELGGIPGLLPFEEGESNRISIATGQDSPPKDIEIFPGFPAKRKASSS